MSAPGGCRSRRFSQHSRICANDDKSEKEATQFFCINYGGEQYGPAVSAISNGTEGCMFCGVTPPVLTTAEYRAILRERAGYFAVKRAGVNRFSEPTETSAQL
jgi:hypothetical protein